MRSRRFTWILLGSVFIAVAILLLWFANRREGRESTLNAVQSPLPPTQAPHSKRAPDRSRQTVKTESTAPMALLAQPRAGGLAKENKFQYRLNNTSRSVGQLLRNDHAILLENALVDTERPASLSIPAHLRAQGDPGSYIVQARRPLDNAFRKLLADAGAAIVSYIPNNAYLVRVSAAGARQLAADPKTQAVLAYEPYYKLKPLLLKPAVEQTAMPPNSGLNVTLFADARNATLEALKKLGAHVFAEDRSPFGPVVTVQVPANSLAAVAGLPGVQGIEPFHPRVPANDLSRVRLGVSMDTIVPTNYLNLDGKNIMVNVNDSGVDATHPDLSPRVIGDVAASLVDTDGHGTHVAGIIASSGANGPGGTNVSGSVDGANFRGKAPAAGIFSIATPLSAGVTLTESYLQETPARTNIFISHNSWNYSGANEYNIGAASYDAAVRDALPGVPGSQPVLFVFSAGNAGNGNDSGLSGYSDTILSPGTAKNVITVGAIEQPRDITNEVTAADGSTNTPWKDMTSSANQVASFSSRGNVGIGIEGDFGRYKPDLVAPGTFVVSTRSGNWDTNAYYNPTNHHYNPLSDQFTDPDSTNYGDVFLPDNTVQLTIDLVPTPASPSPFPDMPIFVWQGTDPTVDPPSFPPKTNHVSVPPDAALSPVPGDWWYGIGNVSTQTVYYDIVTDIITTNDLGTYFDVLRTNLNDPIGPYYSYESGTSMSAADASGVLALMQEFFQGHGLTNSPALMKALLINGARSVNPLYDFRVRSPENNYQGWGLIKLPTTLPPAITNLSAGQLLQPSSIWFVDQSPTNALATGQGQTYTVTVTTNAQSLPLRITLVWTDPPGDPAASVKLVNDLDLVVTNLDTLDVYFGNDILVGSIFNSAWDTNTPPNVDSVNNVENVYLDALDAPLGANYSVTVSARRVNVNAVTAQANNVAQDYALVISSGDGEVPDALTVTPASPVTFANAINLTQTTNTFNNGTFAGAILLNQRAGANFQLLGTNAVPLGTNTIWGTNGAITLGVTNQWHFYVITNTGGIDFTNAAFVTFLPPDLSLPRMGVRESDLDNAARAEADIDLYVSADPALLDLDPAAVTAADKSLGRGGTEVISFTNSAQGNVYYIGVKAEDQMAAEYGFLGVFSSVPFSEMSSNGMYVRGFPLPVAIPDGNNANPGGVRVFGLAVQEMKVRRVVVTNSIWHQNLGDLVGNLSHGQKFAVLNNHRNADPAIYPPPGPYPFIYEDNGEGNIVPPPVSPPYTVLKSDGPGSLRDFVGEEALGMWLLTMIDNHQTQTGSVQTLSLLLQPQNITNGTPITLAPNTWTYDSIDVPPEATNLTVSVTFDGGSVGPVDLYVRRGAFPTQTQYDKSLTGITAPGGSLSIGVADSPPLNAGRYFIGVFNSSGVAQTIRIMVTVALNPAGITPVLFTSTNTMPILDDAVTNSSLFVSNDNRIVSVEVGVRIDHPRVSDLALTLVSPQGTRVLLAENRGGLTPDGFGGMIYTTNFFPQTTNGDWQANTNIIGPVPTSGTLWIDYDFYAIPDTLSVNYDGTNVFGSGSVSNAGRFVIPYGPGSSTNLTIVMNEGNNADTNSQWEYTATVVNGTLSYLMFTENTNLAQAPIKFALPPFGKGTNGTSFVLPEEPFQPLVGQNAQGLWQLEIWDNRVGDTNPAPQLVSWQLRFIFERVVPPATELTHGVTVTNTVGANEIQYFYVDVPIWATAATNTLVAASAPVNLLFNQKGEPTGTNGPDDFTLLSGVTSGVFTLTSNSVPPLISGQRYYLGVQNTNATPVTFALRVEFDITTLSNGVPVAGVADTTYWARMFQYDVSSNATAVAFALTNLSGDVDLVARKGLPLPTLSSYDYGSFAPGTNDELIVVFPNSTPVPLSPGRWYLGVFNADVTNVDYTIVAIEFTNALPTIITLTNAIPYFNTNPGVSSPIDYYRYVVSRSAVRAQFEINGPSENMALVARKGFPPLPDLTAYDYLSDNPGMNDELIVLFDSSTPVPLTTGEWYLSAVNEAGIPVSYSIMATEWPVYGTNFGIIRYAISSDSFCITWSSLPGVHYVVEGTPSLPPPFWTNVSPTITATGTETTWCVPLPSPYHFFRVREGLALGAYVPSVSFSKITVTPGAVQLEWIAATNLQFQVQWTASLAPPPPWNTFTNILTSTTGLFTFTDDGSQTGGLGATRFYRLLVLP